jgi:spore coat protein CotF
MILEIVPKDGPCIIFAKQGIVGVVKFTISPKLLKELFTMPFGAHETMEVHEILNEKINMINHFTLYAEQAQSSQVRSLVEHQLKSAIGHYDQLVAYTHDYSASEQGRGQVTPFYRIANTSYQDIQYGLHQPASTAPQYRGGFNDQQILASVLSCHKNSAKNGFWASLECADPNVRQMLMEGAFAANNHAYETFLLMNQQGQYQVPTMNDHTAKTYLHTYQPVQSRQGFQQ